MSVTRCDSVASKSSIFSAYSSKKNNYKFWHNINKNYNQTNEKARSEGYVFLFKNLLFCSLKI